MLALLHSFERSINWLSCGRKRYRFINSVTAFLHSAQLSSNWKRWKPFAAAYSFGLQEEIYGTAYAAAAWLKSKRFNKKVYVIGENGE